MHVGDEEGWWHAATIRIAESGLWFPLPTSSSIWKNNPNSCSGGESVRSRGRTSYAANSPPPQLVSRAALPGGHLQWWVFSPRGEISPLLPEMDLGKLKSAETSAAPCFYHHKQS